MAQIDARTGMATGWNAQVSAPYYPYDDGPYVGAVVTQPKSRPVQTVEQGQRIALESG